MTTPVISTMPRLGQKKSDIKKIRAAGDIPAVIYGKAIQPMSVIVSGSDYRTKAVGHKLLNVTLNGRTIPVMVQDVMMHPIDRNVLHIELHAVALDQEISAHIPIFLHGVEVVEKHGGVIQQQVREAEVIGLPSRFPDSFQLNVETLHVGDSLHMKDIELPEGLILRSDAEEVVLSVIAPKYTEPTEEVVSP